MEGMAAVSSAGAGAGPVGMAAAVAIQVYASYMQGVNASVNGILVKAQDEILAQQFLEQGRDETNYIERVSQARLGRNKAAAAGGNVDATQGSPLLVMADQLRQDKQNEATTLTNAFLKAQAARIAGDQGMAAGTAGKQAGELGAAATALMGYARYKGLTSHGDNIFDMEG